MRDEVFFEVAHLHGDETLLRARHREDERLHLGGTVVVDSPHGDPGRVVDLTHRP
ncbi:hypothetical protein [Kineococcus aurantiacus]|uniref:Uncharacterized protein n=1 Tax=Kineococcus aurantiacus TaxID=37633 RepID=A0A7Y9DN61_9ACTN|nr:hypothetical protein [Kineococcus aurantiacus]NYD23687.1 hypothetical protein [Kineococcus aurantiacus]